MLTPAASDRLAALQQEFGIENLTIFPHLPGMTRVQVVDQLERFAQHVSPVLRAQAETIEAAPPAIVEPAAGALSEIQGHHATTAERPGPQAATAR